MALFRREQDGSPNEILRSLEQRWIDIQEYGLGDPVTVVPSDLILKVDDLTWESIKEGLKNSQYGSEMAIDSQSLTTADTLI